MAEESRLERWSRNFRVAWMRSKPLDREAMMDTPLNRSLTQFHVLMYGIGTMIGNAIYGVIAVVARKYSGPSSFLCFLLAGFIGFLNGMSYSELSAQIPKAGSAFVYTYVIAGEFLAFMAGWLALLEYISTASSAAVLASNTIDILSNGTLADFVREHIGELSSSNDGVISQYPNILAFLISLLAIALLTCGNDASFMINCILSVVTVGIILMASIFMYIHFDKEYLLSNSHNLFFPNDIIGFLSGSGIAFGTFIGFEAMTVAGEEVKDPQRTIPKATFKAIGIVCVMSVVYALAFTAYTPWWHVDPNMGLAFIFIHPPVMWLRIIVCIGTLAAAFCSMLCSLYAITRIIYSMASDGLIFKFLSWVQPKLQVPLIALYSFGLMCGVISIFFTYASLTSFMSISAVLAYIIVSCDLLILRFRRPELYPDKFPVEVGYLQDKFQKLKFLNRESRGMVPCVALVFFIISSSALLYFFMDLSHSIYHGYPWAIAVLVILVVLTISLMIIIALFEPYREKSEFFMVPFVPYIPLLCIFLNIAVIIKLPNDSWIRVGMWISIGLVLYLFYGIWNSTLVDVESKEEEYSVVRGRCSIVESEIMKDRGRMMSIDSVMSTGSTANENSPILKR